MLMKTGAHVGNSNLLVCPSGSTKTLGRGRQCVFDEGFGAKQLKGRRAAISQKRKRIESGVSVGNVSDQPIINFDGSAPIAYSYGSMRESVQRMRSFQIDGERLVEHGHRFVEAL